jgi:hypothetical protein
MNVLYAQRVLGRQPGCRGERVDAMRSQNSLIGLKPAVLISAMFFLSHEKRGGEGWYVYDTHAPPELSDPAITRTFAGILFSSVPFFFPLRGFDSQFDSIEWVCIP